VGRPLLVLYADATDVVIAQYVEYFQIGAARVTEKKFDTLQAETFRQDLCPLQGVRAILDSDLMQ
jgi:hypothetical protein